MNWKMKIGLWLARRELNKNMGGWKTWAGALAQILSGAGLAIIGFSEGDNVKLAAGVALVGRGFADIGIGHKVEKAAEKK
jgi:hypothetical protein